MSRTIRFAVGALGTIALVAVGIAWLGAGRGAIESPPKPRTAPVRIVSMTLATDEMLSELVSPERIVGVTFLADDEGVSNVANFYPQSIPRLRDVDLERIMALEPDLVCVAAYNSADFLKVIERSGVEVYRNGAIDSLDEIEAGIVALGKHVDAPQAAQRMVDAMRARRSQLSDRLRDVRDRPRVLFWSAGFTAGASTTIDDMIREAGALNAATEAGLKGSAEISPERVIAIDPDFVLLTNWNTNDRDADIKHHPLLRNLRAVREHHTITIEARYLSCVSQFAVEGVERLARALHPERFSDDSTPSAGESRPGPSP